jgi:aspartyl-tRNA(Asn)/glutamyl-tRNA(Gln) amidotransferase subunit A
MPDLLSRLERPLTPRLGRLRGLFQDLAEPSVQNMMDDASARFAEQGAAVKDVALPAGFDEVLDCHRAVMGVEAARFHEPRLRRHPEDYKPHIRALIEEGIACPALEYERCKAHQAGLRTAMAACFEGLDALLVPATTSAAPDTSTTGDPAFNSPWSYTGLPSVSFPVARSPQGLPLAVQLIGRPFAEADLFAAAAWCEKTAGWQASEPSV